MFNRRLSAWALGLSALMAIALVIGDRGQPAQAEQAKAGEEALGKGKRAQEFIAAFNKGDAKAVAEFWMPEAEYVDLTGHATKGRAAIQKLYEKTFAEHKGAKLTIHVASARLVTPDVGIEDGITEVIPAEGGLPTVARFSAVLVKKDGTWYLESVHDSVARPPSNAEHLEDLEWLVGDWKGEAAKGEKGESATVSFAWAENQNFLVSTFATTLDGVPVVGGTQWIGWDAVEKQVRSWSFYSGGGFGEALWTNEGHKWALKTTARTADGKQITLTNVLTKVDEDHATWQPTRLIVDGKAVADGPVAKLKRVKPERQ